MRDGRRPALIEGREKASAGGRDGRRPARRPALGAGCAAQIILRIPGSYRALGTRARARTHTHTHTHTHGPRGVCLRSLARGWGDPRRPPVPCAGAASKKACSRVSGALDAATFCLGGAGAGGSLGSNSVLFAFQNVFFAVASAGERRMQRPVLTIWRDGERLRSDTGQRGGVPWCVCH